MPVSNKSLPKRARRQLMLDDVRSHPATDEAQDFERCTGLFETIAEEGAKFQFNIGLVHATIGNHETAVQHFEEAISVDRFLAVAYFQSGVSNFLLERYPEARRDFDDAYSYLRGNQTIDYEQLGLKFCLYSCEVLFNRGLTSLYMGDMDEGMQDLQDASREKQISAHDVIDEALADRGEGYTVFSIPVGVLYRPSEGKLKNLKAKNYLGAAKLVAATDQQDAFTGFTGATLARNATFLRSAAALGIDPQDPGPPVPNLSRSRTTAPRIEREKASLSGVGPPAAAVAAPLRRNQTTVAAARAPARPTPGPREGLKRSNTSGTTKDSRPLPQRERGLGNLPSPPSSEERNQPMAPTTTRDRDTSYTLDAYYDQYDDVPPPPVPTLPLALGATNRDGPTPEGQPIERVANWARQNFGAPPPMTSLTLSRSTSASEKGAAARRPPLRSNTLTTSPSVRLAYADNVSRGDEDIGVYEGTVMSEREMIKIRVKIRHKGDTRGMVISPDLGLEDFVERVRRKFESPSDLPMKYKDSTGELVSLIDSDDFESAVDEAREAAQGRAEGKLEILID